MGVTFCIEILLTLSAANPKGFAAVGSGSDDIAVTQQV